MDINYGLETAAKGAKGAIGCIFFIIIICMLIAFGLGTWLDLYATKP